MDIKYELDIEQSKIKYQKESLFNVPLKLIKNFFIVILITLVLLLISSSISLLKNLFVFNYTIGIAATFLIILIYVIIIYHFLSILRMPEFNLDFLNDKSNSIKNLKKIKKNNNKVLLIIGKNIIKYNKNIFNINEIEQLESALRIKNIKSIREIITKMINTSISEQSKK